jgi:thiol:disulfide interchange protein DsbD
MACCVVGAALIGADAAAIAGGLSSDNIRPHASIGDPSWAAAALVAGLLISLTPCVYPMIAVTVSVFGAREAKTRTGAALLTAVYVLGVAAMFAALGTVAVLFGKALDAVLADRCVELGTALLFFTMAGSMFGLFELDLPQALINRLASAGGVGPRGAFALGLTSALVAGPWAASVLPGIMRCAVASRRALALWVVAFAFACGLGVPFFVVGRRAVGLPKSAAWMLPLQWAYGVVLAGAALRFAAEAFRVLSP